jgi:hypothetical protein
LLHRFAEIKGLPEADEEELPMMTKIVDKNDEGSGPLVYHDGYKERMEALIISGYITYIILYWEKTGINGCIDYRR